MRKLWFLSIVLIFGLFVPLFAQTPKESEKTKKDIQTVSVDGYKLTFEILNLADFKKTFKDLDKELSKGETQMMDADKSNTHHFWVTITEEKSGKKITDAQINMKIINPKNEAQTKMAMFMTNHYCNYFKMSEKGKYQVMSRFKIGEQKHVAGFYYEIK